MSLKMSRRGFVKATAAATASTLLLGSQAATAFADDAAEGAKATSSDDVKIIRARAASAMAAARCSGTSRMAA